MEHRDQCGRLRAAITGALRALDELEQALLEVFPDGSGTVVGLWHEQIRHEGDAHPGVQTGGFVVARNGSWFRPPGGGTVNLNRRHALRRIVKTLAEIRARQPGAALALAAIVEAGWPGEVIQREAAADRAYVAVSTLRRLGLRGLLINTDEGYTLDPGARLEIIDEQEACERAPMWVAAR